MLMVCTLAKSLWTEKQFCVYNKDIFFEVLWFFFFIQIRKFS